MDGNSMVGTAPGLIDGFGRRITYVRLSVTDRCDLRCRYCMSEHMQFLPKSDPLTLEELAALAGIFVDRGVRRIRLTGGEPPVRRKILTLVEARGGYPGQGLGEITMTSNGPEPATEARRLPEVGGRRKTGT